MQQLQQFRTETQRKVVATLEKGLPEDDFRALSAWFATFYPFQLEWLLEPARFALCNKSRQIGLSHTSAGWGTMRAACFGDTTTIISIGEREAFEVLDKAQRHANVLERLGSKWASARLRGETLEFPNTGGRVIALPASSGGRSYSGNVVLDEFGYLEGKAGKVWDSAAAVILHGYAIRVLSTPNGIGNEWHQLWSNPKANKGYAKYEFPIERAISDGMQVNLEECWKMAKGNEAIFDQLFRCDFLVSGNSFFDSKVSRQLWKDAVEPSGRQELTGEETGSAVVGELRVYHRPEKGSKYVISADTSEGTGGDASACHVYERGSGRLMAVIDGQLKPWDLARHMARIGAWYNGALAAVERNFHGITTLRALKMQCKYPNIFADRDEKDGWRTGPDTRAPALDTLEQAHRAGHWVPRDKAVIREVMTFIVTAQGRPQAANGTHDDHVMCAAIGWDVLCRPAPKAMNLDALPSF